MLSWDHGPADTKSPVITTSWDGVLCFDVDCGKMKEPCSYAVCSVIFSNDLHFKMLNVDVEGRLWSYDSYVDDGRMCVLRDVGEAMPNVCSVMPGFTARNVVLRLADFTSTTFSSLAGLQATTTNDTPPSCCRRNNWYQAGDEMTIFQTRYKNAAYQHEHKTLVIRDIACESKTGKS